MRTQNYSRQILVWVAELCTKHFFSNVNSYFCMLCVCALRNAHAMVQRVHICPQVSLRFSGGIWALRKVGCHCYTAKKFEFMYSQKRNSNSFSKSHHRLLLAEEVLLCVLCKDTPRKFETNISRKGTARLQSQFPHSCVCEVSLYFQVRPNYFPAAE